MIRRLGRPGRGEEVGDETAAVRSNKRDKSINYIFTGKKEHRTKTEETEREENREL